MDLQHKTLDHTPKLLARRESALILQPHSQQAAVVIESIHALFQFHAWKILLLHPLAS